MDMDHTYGRMEAKRRFGKRLPLHHQNVPRTVLGPTKRKWERVIAEREVLWAEAYDKGWNDRENFSSISDRREAQAEGWREAHNAFCLSPGMYGRCAHRSHINPYTNEG